jgi:hypothetical protein
LRLTARGARLSIEPTTWHPGFNQSVPNTVVVATFEGPSIACELAVE